MPLYFQDIPLKDLARWTRVGAVWKVRVETNFALEFLETERIRYEFCWFLVYYQVDLLISLPIPNIERDLQHI